jgi:NAD(P)H-dependent FMN reductase
MAAFDASERGLTVVGIPGSLRDPSYTRFTVKHALKGAEQAGADTHLADLRRYDLPFCDGSQEQGEEGDVARLREEVREADGLVLGTPEYHGSYSGVLKNALDLMGFDEFEGKMIGLVAVSGGRMGGFGAMTALREVGRALHAWVVPTQASIPKAWSVYDDETGQIEDADLEERVRGVGEEVVRYARLHEAEEKLAFLREWECATENPGAEGR